jgi:hypothetical protein
VIGGAPGVKAKGRAAGISLRFLADYGMLLVLAWAAVALPLAWGGWITLSKALVFFR